MNFLGWREVPVKADVLGSRAVECMPCIMQGFIERPKKVEQGIDFDRKLYIVRRVFEMIHMWHPFPAVLSLIKECSW